MRNRSPIVKFRRLLIAGMLVMSSMLVAQNPSVRVFEDWSTTSGTQNNFQRSIVRSKTLGGAVYYYTCGSTLNSAGNYDLMVQKKNASGTVLWTNTYTGAGAGNDYATDVQIDAVGNVYICGTYYKDATDSNNAVIVKYNTAGTHKWTATYNGAGSRHDALAALQVSGNHVIAVGTTWKNSTNKFDFLAMRYDSSGNQVWAQTWDHNNLNDVAVNMWNNGTRIYIAGGAQSAVTTYKYAVVNVKASDGSIQGSTVTGGTAFGFDQLTDIQYDQNGFIYLTGGVINTGTVYDIKTVKLDTALNIIWSATYASSGAYNDVGTGLAIDQVGNVIVTGYRTDATTGKDYVTIKYSSGGTQRWVSTFDGGINADDSATCIVVNPTDTNKIYVSGFSYNGSSKDYWTLKYDGLGNLMWDIGFNNIYNTDDRATSVALDTLGNVIVAGQNKLNDTTHTYTTVKFIEKATTLHDDTLSSVSTSVAFTENRGQVMGTDTAAHPEVKFYTINHTPDLFFLDTAVCYVFAKLDTSVASNDSIMRVDMKFVNANPDQKIRAMDQREDYLNFFLPQVPEGRSNVPNYNQLISFNVWNKVDIVYGSNLTGMKYYFVCKPLGGGGSSSQIDLYYDGADSVKINAAGQLIIYTPLGNIVQPKPQVWQLDPSGNFSGLAWQPSYSIVGTNEVRFTGFGSYNVAWPLVIAIDRGNAQPQNIQNLTWSTYYGGNTSGVSGEFNDIVLDKQGNAIVTGYSDAVDFPVQLSITTWFPINGMDATVVKFKPSGQRDWATYYGGIAKQNGATGSSEGAYSVDVDKAGKIIFVGSTQSYVDMPLQNWGSAYFRDTNNCSGTGCTQLDAFIGYLSSNGQTLIWGTYLGGLNFDRALEVKVSSVHNDIYVCGTSRGGFPLDSSTALWNSTVGHGFITRFSSTGDMLWSTMIGSSASPSNSFYDGVSDIAIDKNGDVIFAGNVVGSAGFPVLQNTCTDSSNNTFGGSGDAFISKFNGNTNDLEWSTFYGSNYFDYVWTIAVDSSLNYYMTGYTQYGSGTDTLPLVNPGGSAYFQSAFGGGTSDAFITEFDQNGCLVWSTLYGGNGRDEGFALAIDSSQNIYTLGQTQSSNILFAVPNLGAAYVDTSFNGGTNDYLNCFKANSHNQIWTTYFGSASSHPFGLGAFEDSTLYATGGVGGCANSGCFPLDNGGGPPVWFQDTITRVTGFISRFDINTSIVGINENLTPEQLNLNVFPNPADGTIWIQGPVTTGEELIIEIYNIAGQLMYSETLSPLTYLNRQLSLNRYSSGMYVVQVRSGNLAFNKKIIVQH